MKKTFLFILVVLFFMIVENAFAEGTAEGYGASPYGTSDPAIYPPYDISKCGNMLGRALAAKFDLAQSGQDYSDASVQILLSAVFENGTIPSSEKFYPSHRVGVTEQATVSLFASARNDCFGRILAFFSSCGTIHNQ